MRISDWSSDVCSSDLERFPRLAFWASSPKTAHPPTKNQPLNPIHIPLPKTCAYNLPVPPSDTPAGVLARRDRRWWWGNDVSLHHRGSRKMVSLRRHGERRRVTDRPFVSRCPKERAGRACAAHMEVDENGVAGRRVRREHRETGGKAPLPKTFEERLTSRAKTAERGAERCHID